VGEYDGSTGLITAVESGRGIALVASTLQCLAGTRVAFVPLQPALPAATMGAVHPAGATAAVANFVRVAKKAAEALS
jgi:DNA-binding transcriptional LysR family regulator